jgi:hypothetical protein
VSVFFPGALHTQLLMASMLIFLCILAQVAGRPFENGITEYSEYVSLFTAFMIFYLANYLFIDSVSEANKQLVTFLIIALVLLFVACIVTAFIKLTREEMHLGPLRRRIQAGHAKGEDIGRILREWRIEQRQKTKAKEEARMLKLQKRSTLVGNEDDSSSSDDVRVARRGAELELNLSKPVSTYQSTLQEIAEQANAQRLVAASVDALDAVGDGELGQGAGVHVRDTEILEVAFSESSDSDDKPAQTMNLGFEAPDVTDSSDSDVQVAHLTFPGDDEPVTGTLKDVDANKKRSFMNSVAKSRSATDGASDASVSHRPAARVPPKSHEDRYAEVTLKGPQ